MNQSLMKPMSKNKIEKKNTSRAGGTCRIGVGEGNCLLDLAKFEAKPFLENSTFVLCLTLTMGLVDPGIVSEKF